MPPSSKPSRSRSDAGGPSGSSGSRADALVSADPCAGRPAARAALLARLEHCCRLQAGRDAASGQPSRRLAASDAGLRPGGDGRGASGQPKVLPLSHGQGRRLRRRCAALAATRTRPGKFGYRAEGRHALDLRGEGRRARSSPPTSPRAAARSTSTPTATARAVDRADRPGVRGHGAARQPRLRLLQRLQEPDRLRPVRQGAQRRTIVNARAGRAAAGRARRADASTVLGAFTLEDGDGPPLVTPVELSLEAGVVTEAHDMRPPASRG